jgi:GR25 family glycosyltransferase involved in LPS biosynthesis
VTDKHIRAWSAFLESDADYLLCCEDDVIFKEDSVQRVNDLLEMLIRRQGDAPIYIDLAGGCRFDEIKIDALEVGRDASFRFYSKPVTNTACAYLMSRSLVVAFHEILTRKPWLRLIGVDWMMNKLFMLMENDGVACACMHADPTIFKHGTTTGDYVAWER